MLILPFPQGLIENRTDEEGRHRPVQPDEKGDDGTDGAINDGIAPHIIHIVGKGQGIDHPKAGGKSRTGKDEPPRRGMIGGKIIDGGNQQDEGCRHGQKAGFRPDGNELLRDREKLGHEVQNAFANDHQNQHHRNENQNQKRKQKHPFGMTNGFFFAVDIGNGIGQVFHRPIGKPEGKDQTKGKRGTIAGFGHMGNGEVQ